MEQVNLPIDPSRIAYGFLSSKKEINENIEVEKAITQNFYCQKCNKEITGVKFKQINNDKWEDIASPYCIGCCDEIEFGDIGVQIHNIHNDNLINEYWNIEHNLINAGFKNFEEINEHAKYAKEVAEKYTKGFTQKNSSTQNLLFIGEQGTGKSHLAIAIARNIDPKGFKVGVCNFNDILSRQLSYYKNPLLKSDKHILQDIGTFALFILDDIFNYSHKNNFFQNKLEEIINIRQGKPTIYTTCVPAADLKSVFGKRVNSRIQSNTLFLETGYFDYRKNQKLN